MLRLVSLNKPQEMPRLAKVGAFPLSRACRKDRLDDRCGLVTCVAGRGIAGSRPPAAGFPVPGPRVRFLRGPYRPGQLPVTAQTPRVGPQIVHRVPQGGRWPRGAAVLGAGACGCAQRGNPSRNWRPLRPRPAAPQRLSPPPTPRTPPRVVQHPTPSLHPAVLAQRRQHPLTLRHLPPAHSDCHPVASSSASCCSICAARATARV